VRHPVYLSGIGAHLAQSTTEIAPSSFKGRKLRAMVEKVAGVQSGADYGSCYNIDDNFMSCKICTKAKKSNGLSKESQGGKFQNTALCRRAGLQEHQMANLRPHAICPQGYGTHVHRSGTRSLQAM